MPEMKPEQPKPAAPRQVPAVGRIVHYTSLGSEGGKYPAQCRAAIITQVAEPGNPESAVGLCILNPTGSFYEPRIEFGVSRGQWHWPEIVPAV